MPSSPTVPRTVRTARRRTALTAAALLSAGSAVLVHATPASAATDPLFGTCLRNGLPFPRALELADNRFGPMETVRVFYPGAPAEWSSPLGTVKRSLSVSFRYTPKDVLAGKADAYMTQWFRAAPKTRTTWWTYSHEPEDQVRNGVFTAADYRAAWRHLSALADRADNPRLVPTLTLMYWTFNPASGRDWHDYLASGVIRVVAIDGYNWGANRTPEFYADPDRIFGGSFRAIRKAGLVPAAGEVGSVLIKGDGDGSGRARFIHKVGRYMREQRVAFADWYDYDHGSDYQLDDGPSIRAWRSYSAL